MSQARRWSPRIPDPESDEDGGSVFGQGSGSGSSVLAPVLVPVLEETGRTLQDAAFAIRYADFAHLKVMTFEKLRALALSDLYEDVSDLARCALLKVTDVAPLREIPEYAEIKEKLVLAMAGQRTDVVLEAKEWLNGQARLVARQEIVRTLRRGISDGNRDAAKVAVEVLERDLPKLSRNNDQSPIVMLPDALLERLSHALEVIERNTKKAKPKTLPEGAP